MAKCDDCGLIGVRDETTGQLAEVEERCRVTGTLPSDRVGHVICSARMTEFSESAEDLSREFKQERNCPAFAKWHPGFTAKEHSEMLNAELLTKTQQQWQEQQANREDERAERDREWRQEDVRLLKADMRVKAFAPVVAAIIGAILGGIIGWYAKG